MHFVRDIAFGSDMRYARLKLQRRIEYHCDRREQYHFCEAKISRRAVRGISLRNIPPENTLKKSVTHYTLQARRVKRSTNKPLVLLLLFCKIQFCFMVGTTRVVFCFWIGRDPWLFSLKSKYQDAKKGYYVRDIISFFACVYAKRRRPYALSSRRVKVSPASETLRWKPS